MGLLWVSLLSSWLLPLSTLKLCAEQRAQYLPHVCVHPFTVSVVGSVWAAACVLPGSSGFEGEEALAVHWMSLYSYASWLAKAGPRQSSFDLDLWVSGGPFSGKPLRNFSCLHKWTSSGLTCLVMPEEQKCWVWFPSYSSRCLGEGLELLTGSFWGRNTGFGYGRVWFLGSRVWEVALEGLVCHASGKCAPAFRLAWNVLLLLHITLLA